MRRISALILALAFVLALAGCGASAPSSPSNPSQSDGTPAPEKLSPIKLGATLSQTGVNAHGGTEALQAMQLLIDEVNANGGVKGRQIQLLVENTNSEPEQAVNGALKLTNEDKVLALLGPDNGSTATAIKEQVAEVDEIVQISVTGSSPKLTADNPRWYFRGATPSTYQTAGLVEYLTEELGFSRIAVLCDDSLTDQADSLQADLKKHDIEPVAVQTHKIGNTNFNGQLLTVKNANPDCIFFIGYPTECASAIKQARDLGIEAQFAGSIGIVYNELCELGGDLTEGVLGTIGFTANNPDEAVQAFVNAYVERYGTIPEHAAGQAYDQLTLVLKAIEESDLSFDVKDIASDRTMIRDWLEQKANGFKGLSGVIKYTEEDHTAYESVNLMIVKDGKWTVLRASN
jgi:branched-chain amino acid transport system substrate-binding protein